MAARTFLFIVSSLYLVNFTSAFSLQHVMTRLDALEAKFDMIDMENKLRRSETKELFRRVSEISTSGKMITASEHVSRDASSDYGEHVSPKGHMTPLDRTTILPFVDKNKTTESALEFQKLESYLIKGAKNEKDNNLKLRRELKDIVNMLKTDYAMLESIIKEEIRSLTNHLSEIQKSLERDYASFKSIIIGDFNNFKDDITKNQTSLVTEERFDNFTDFVTTALSIANNESRQAIILLKLEFEMSTSEISNNVSTVSKTLANINNRQTKIRMSMQELSNGLVSMDKTLTYIHGFYSCRRPYSGVYNIYLGENSVSSVRVYCDQTTDGGGWIVFQRRHDGSVDFERTWADYKTGFGNLEGEFWLGNDNLHALTSAGFNELHIDLEDFDGNRRYAKYSHFKVKSESEKYELEVRGYSGDAGDSLNYHNGMSFSTKDRDNDRRGDSCSVEYRGAWWYNECHYANLNGFYYSGTNSPYAKGVNWYHWRGYSYSLKRVEMKIR